LHKLSSIYEEHLCENIKKWFSAIEYGSGLKLAKVEKLEKWQFQKNVHNSVNLKAFSCRAIIALNLQKGLT
jgi:hypothetical protein